MKFEDYLAFWNEELYESPKPQPPSNRPVAVCITAILAAAVVALGTRDAPIKAYCFVTVPLTALAVLALKKNL